MAGTYSYLTLAQLRGELLARLQDAGGVYTPASEANLYIAEGLHLLNALTCVPGQQDYILDFNPGDTWKSLNVAGSPRQRTVTDSSLYSQMEAMLLEPMSGGTWTGTSQFNIGLLSAALQYRRDELLLQSAANAVNLLLASPVLSQRTYLPDTTIDVFRVRWIPSDGSMPYALGREDANTVEAFGVQLGIQPGAPDSWLITSTPPLSFDCSCPPNQPGTWDTILSAAGASFAPPAATLVGIPDDWTPALLYGALADVLANAPEGRDIARSKYCLQRYEGLKKAMLSLPWLLHASVASVDVDTPSVEEMDAWQQDWENVQPADDPQMVVGGIDLVALAPFVQPGGAQVQVALTMVGSAPIPANDAAFVQLSRDGVDALLNYAQHVAMFKTGGADFAATMPLYEQFETYCRQKNAEYAALGVSLADLRTEGNRNDEFDPRFLPGGKRAR